MKVVIEVMLWFVAFPLDKRYDLSWKLLQTFLNSNSNKAQEAQTKSNLFQTQLHLKTRTITIIITPIWIVNRREGAQV